MAHEEGAAPSGRALRHFLRWMRQAGFVWSKGISFGFGSVSNVGVWALKDFAEGTCIATIPRAGCLSVAQSCAARALEEANVGGMLALAVAFLAEKSRGSLSPWADYLQLLPEAEDTPLLWPAPMARRLLQGTELAKTIEADRRLMAEDWREVVLPLAADVHGLLSAPACTLEAFMAANSVVASRAFDIDSAKTKGLVPLADMFNHRTACEDVHFFTGSDSEGEEDVEGEREEEQEEAGGEQREDHGVAAGNAVLRQQGQAEDVEGLPQLANGHAVAGSDGEQGEACESFEDMEMRLVRSVKVGTEIFNTYGELGNAALLHRYGFTEAGNPFEHVNLDLALLLEAAPAAGISLRQARARCALWTRLGFEPLESQGTRYFEIAASGQPQVEALLLAHLVCADLAGLQDVEGAEEQLLLSHDEHAERVEAIAKLLGWRPAHPGKRKRGAEAEDPSPEVSAAEDAEDRRPVEPWAVKAGSLEAWLCTKAAVILWLSALEERNRAYPTESLSSDRSIQKSLDLQKSPRDWHALTLRIGEREVLQRCQTALRAVSC